MKPIGRKIFDDAFKQLEAEKKSNFKPEGVFEGQDPATVLKSTRKLLNSTLNSQNQATEKEAQEGIRLIAKSLTPREVGDLMEQAYSKGVKFKKNGWDDVVIEIVEKMIEHKLEPPERWRHTLS